MGFMDKFKEISDKVNEQKAKQEAAAKAGTLHPGAKTFTTTHKTAAPSAPAPKSGPVAAAAPAANAIVYGELTKIRFGTQTPIPFRDGPSGLSVYVRYNGDAALSMIEPGAKFGTDLAKSIIVCEMSNEICKISEQNVSADQLPSFRNQLTFAASKALREKGVEAKIMLASLTIDEASSKKLAEIKRKQELASMSPDEAAKRLAKAQAEAMATMKAGRQPGAAGAGSIGAGMAAAAAPGAASPLITTCPACGAPAGLAKFCSSCGSPLRQG